jgi:predicted double-glycine peptidase
MTKRNHYFSSIFFLLSLLLYFGLAGCQMNGTARQPVRSLEEIKWQDIERQQYDYSCGTGALATLLKGYFNDNLNETELLFLITSHLDTEQQQDRAMNGFSLYDLQEACINLEYRAVGVKLEFNHLAGLKGPILIHLNDRENGIKHFAVFRGIIGNRVYLADPSRGQIRVFIPQFLAQWDGYALLVGKNNLEMPDNYPLRLADEPSEGPEYDPHRFILGM